MRLSRRILAGFLALNLMNSSALSALAQTDTTSVTDGTQRQVIGTNSGTQLDSNNLDVEVKRKVKEIPNKRTHNSKQYLLEDGSYQAEIYKDDIHYKDVMGNLQDIQPRFMDESEITSLKTTFSKDFTSKLRSQGSEYTQKIKREGSNYIAAQVPFSVEVPKRIINGYGVGKDGNEILIIPLNVSQTATAVLDKTTGSKLTYHNAWKNTDLELIVTSTGIKENIILNNSDSPKKLSFEISRKITDKTNADNISLLPMWLVDNKGLYRDVAVKERKEGLKTYLDVEWDASGLEYPVTIDPSVVTPSVGNLLTIVNRYGLEFSPYDIQVGGLQGLYGHSADTISYIMYSLPQLPKDVKVTSAVLSLYYIRYINASGGRYNLPPMLDLYPYYVDSEITSEKKYSWETKPFYSTTLSGQMLHIGLTSPTNTLYDSNITQLVKKAYERSRNKLSIALVSSNHNLTKSDIRVVLGNGYMTSKSTKITINYDTDVDIAPPTAPTELLSESFDNSNVYLSWVSSTDNVGVKQYNIYDGDTLIGSTPNTNYVVPNVIKPSIYRFKVRAVDAANNASLDSNISTIDFSDITPPTRPMNLAFRDVKLKCVTLSWTPSTDNSGISKYIIRDQSTNKEYITTDTTYTINDLNSSSTYSYSVTAVDLIGNRSNSSEVLQVTTDGYINKNLEVKVDGLSTDEGSYNARTYRNGKTYVNISGLTGDVNGLVEGIDYIKEGMDYWYSTKYLLQQMNVTETSVTVSLTPKTVATMKNLQLLSVSESVYKFSVIPSVSEDVYGARSISNYDFDGMLQEVYDFLYTHPDSSGDEINEFFKSLRVRINNNLKITEKSALQTGSFSANSTTADSGYEPGPLNSQELALEKENSHKAFWSLAVGALALVSAENMFDINELSNGNGDAFRHAYWGAMMVADPYVGYNWAGRWGTAHEEGEPNNPADQKIMDLYNNFAGRSIGLLYTTKLNGRKLPDSWMEDLKREVLLALENGELKRIDNEPMFTSQTQIATFNSLSAITPMGATINPYDNIEMSAKHMKTDTTGKKTSTQQAPAGMVHIRTYLSINRFKNGWGSVQFVGNNQITIRAWINNTFRGKTYEDITIPMDMTLYKAGYFATPQSIKTALAKYFEKKKNDGIYVRQWGAESSGIFYKVDGMSQFNVFGGNRSGSWIDINTFINSMGPLWETEYLAYTNSDALRDLQKSLDLISVFPVVGVVAGGGSIVIGFVTGNTKEAALAAGFTVAGPVIGKFTNYAGSAVLRVYNSTQVKTILQNAGSSISNLKIAIKNTSSNLDSLITNVYSGFNGRIELEFADIGRMNFNQAHLIEGTNEVAQARYKNFLETKWAETSPQINTTFEDAMAGQHFTKSGRIKVLKANVTYRANGYSYTTDNFGRINRVEGDLVLNAASRNEYAQSIAGRQDRIRDLQNPDAGGHLIASSFNGSGDLDNLVPMNAQINGPGGKWYQMEEVWRQALNAHYSVNVKIESVYSGVSQRPSSFKVKYTINGNPTNVTILNQAGG